MLARFQSRHWDLLSRRAWLESRLVASMQDVDESIGVADLNGDGMPDIVAGRLSVRTHQWLTNRRQAR